jgi:hypothetical protein
VHPPPEPARGPSRSTEGVTAAETTAIADTALDRLDPDRFICAPRRTRTGPAPSYRHQRQRPSSQSMPRSLPAICGEQNPQPTRKNSRSKAVTRLAHKERFRRDPDLSSSMAPNSK